MGNDLINVILLVLFMGLTLIYLRIKISENNFKIWFAQSLKNLSLIVAGAIIGFHVVSEIYSLRFWVYVLIAIFSYILFSYVEYTYRGKNDRKKSRLKKVRNKRRKT